MSVKTQKVDQLFPGISCSQTIFSLFSPEIGLDEKTALKIASGFGGGMACAETCGAVTGSYMVIGLKHGHSSNDPTEKANTKQFIKDFNNQFIEEHGTLICKNLVGSDISTPEGYEVAVREEVFTKRCPQFLKTACTILEKSF